LPGHTGVSPLQRGGGGAEALDLAQRLLHIHRQTSRDPIGSEDCGRFVQQFLAAGGLGGDGGIGEACCKNADDGQMFLTQNSACSLFGVWN
jgi:hypothetical protein